MDEIYDRITESRASQSGNWIKDGKYLFAVKEIKYQKLHKGQTWITELVVMRAEPMPGVYEKDGQACHANEPGATLVIPNAVGSVGSFTRITDDARTPNSPGDVKAFVIALVGTTEAKFDAEKQAWKIKHMQEQMMWDAQAQQGIPENQRVQMTRAPDALLYERICKPEQIMRGFLIECETSRGTIQKGDNKGKPIVKQKWKHVPFTHSDPAIKEIIAREIKERRLAIDQNVPLPQPTVWPVPPEPGTAVAMPSFLAPASAVQPPVAQPMPGFPQPGFPQPGFPQPGFPQPTAPQQPVQPQFQPAPAAIPGYPVQQQPQTGFAVPGAPGAPTGFPPGGFPQI